MDDLENLSFPVSAWSDGGNGYGFRLSNKSRDKFFSKEWKYVLLQLPDEEEPIKITLSHSFWKKCSELRSVEIRKWLFYNMLCPWKKGNPPKFLLVKRIEYFFQLRKP